jgi:UDP-galactopyranose mutase
MKIGGKDKIVIVGAGLSGAVLAERYASQGKEVIVLEKRDHIAGNTYDYIAQHGIMKSKYGAHIFHTSDVEVWNYVNSFSDWKPYEHRVLSSVYGKLVPVPANIDTYNTILGTNFQKPEELQAWIEAQPYFKKKNPKNSEDSALKRLGSRILYENMFKNYTKKQWDMYPKELEASVMDRIPVRFDHNDRYFSDTYEGMPTEGYTKLVENMLNNENIIVMLNTDYFDHEVEAEKLFFTGPIDRYFNNKFGELQYRSIKFEDTLVDDDSFQRVAVINYPSTGGYTRIIEHKKLYGIGEEGFTIVTKEYSTWDGEPYYPCPTQRNRDLYEQYRLEAEKAEDVIFVGRLANYKYINMDQAIRLALDCYEANK